ncbi:glycosyltransferase family 4 protein [Gracilimonas sp.]|uniref:glycosyltransferase family 4 protein n=1 Tax=Gracilimonas sp. TaxID=1974203 RepID=UPI0032EE7429
MAQTKKVLIITYYWPPSGGSGVQRWVKFAKYLREFGWEPIIYTPSNPERPAIDHSLSKDVPKDLTVIKQPIWEPYIFYKKLVGLKKDEKLGSGLMKTGKESSFFHSLSVWIRGNFFIPDARKFWIRPSVKFLTDHLRDNPVDAIISTGPPHSMHMIAMNVTKQISIPWLADFRDPWTNIDFFEELRLSKYARKKHHKLESKVLKTADDLVVISPTMKKEFQEITNTPVSVVPNGFDKDDFSEESYHPDSVFSLSHVGMMTPTRNPQVLWETLSELSKENHHFRNNFKLRLIGKIDGTIKEDIDRFNIQHLVQFESYVPHNEIIRIQQQSDALLLIINNTPNAPLILTGKLFEYLAAKRPIICLSPVDGDAKEVIDETKAGRFILYSERDRLKSEIMRLFQNWQEGINSYEGIDAEKYSRRSLTKKIATQLNELVS